MQDPNKPVSATRQEKFSILEALLGAETVAKLGHPSDSHGRGRAAKRQEVDPKKVEWHRNKLLERFRSKGERANQDTARFAASGKTATSPRGPMSIDHRLAQFASSADLATEHPAVIARILSRMDRAARVNTLKALPGPVARSVVQRLR